jgi:hypothetical protein
MGYYSDDVYYNPEKFGLKTVGEIEWNGNAYEFYITVIWKNDAGEYFMATDSGCSCPSPFEDFTSVESLEGPFDKEAVKYHLRERMSAQTDTSWAEKSVGELRKEVNLIIRRLK